MIRSRAHKVDRNQTEIVNALRACGVPVWILSGSGGGVPDLLAGSFRRRFVFLEVKVPGEHLTEPQKVFFETFRGYPVHVVTSIDEALIAVGVEKPLGAKLLKELK
jgi:hypothetical protein